MPVDMSRYMPTNDVPALSDGAQSGVDLAQFGRNALDLAGWIGRQPLARGVLTALDTPGRTARGAIAGQNPVMDGALDPEGDDDRTEAQLDKYVVPTWNSIARSTGSLPLADPGSPGRALAKFLYQTVTDPTTFIPGADAISIGKRLAKYVGAGAEASGVADKVSGATSAVGAAAAKAAPKTTQGASDLLDSIKQTFTTSSQAKKAFTDPTLNDVRASEANEIVTRGGLQAKYADTLDHLQVLPPAATQPGEMPDIGGVVVPASRVKRPAALPPDQPNRVADLGDELNALPVVRPGQDFMQIGATSRDLRDPAVRAKLSPAAQQTLADTNAITDAIGWRLGSRRNHGQMIARGYRPTAEERALPILNILDNDHGVGYLPERDALGAGVDEQAKIAGQYTVKPQGQALSPYDNAKGVNTYAVTPLPDRLATYMNSAAYLEAQRGRDLDLYTKLGLVPTQQARTRARLADAQANAEDNLAQATFDKSDRTPSAAFSDAAMFRANNSLRRAERYQKLLDAQDAQEAQNAATRAAAFMPNAPTFQGAVPGVFRSEGDALAAAGRDVRAGNADASPMMRDREGTPTVDPAAAFDQYRNLLGLVDTSGTKATLARQGAVLRTQTQGASAARQALLKTQGRDAANTQAFQDALDAGQQLLKAQAEKGYDAALLSDKRLTDQLKQYDGLSKLQDVGYARSGGDVGLGSFTPETQSVLTRAGQTVRGTIDPVFKYALNATSGQSVQRPFAQAADAIAKSTTQRRAASAPVQSLADAFDVKRKAQADKILGTMQALGAKRDVNSAIGAVQGAAQNDVLNAGELAGAPQYLMDRLHGQRVRQEPNALQRLGGILAQSLYAVPTGHGSNVAQQMLFAGGKAGGLRASLAGAGRSIRVARGDAQAIAERDAAKRVGAIPAHGYELQQAPTNPIARFYDAGQRGLTNFHEGQATEMLQREIRAGMRPEDAAQSVRDAFGNHLETSVGAKVYQDSGRTFARWILSTLPTTAKKIASSPENRGRAVTFARGVNAANTEYLEPNYGVDFHPGGTLERAATLLFSPAKYATGTSFDDAIGTIGEDVKRGGLQALAGRLPGAGPALSLLGQPLTDRQIRERRAEPLPAAARIIPALFGSYYTPAETFREKRRRDLVKAGYR